MRQRLVEHVRCCIRRCLRAGQRRSAACSRAPSGLAADLAAGGLTLGAGTLLGALAGAAAGGGIARGVNVLRGQREVQVRWDDELLDGLVVSALLRYLAVAHFGRSGQGRVRQSEYPPFWQEIVQQAVAARRPVLAALWARRTAAGDAANLEAGLRSMLAETARAVLATLYR